MTRDAFHPARTFAPQRPLERPAPAFPHTAALPLRCSLSSPFHPHRSFRSPCGLGPRSRAPLPAGVRFSEPLASLADFCNLKRRAGTPDERSILARERGFRPAAPRHRPMPAALASPMRCRLGGLRVMTCMRRLDARAHSTCVDEASPWAGVIERRRACVCVRLPSSCRSGHPGRRFDPLRSLERFAARRPTEIHFGCHPAKGDTVGRIEVPSSASEPLRDRRIAPPCAPGPRLRHAASVKALLWRLATPF